MEYRVKEKRIGKDQPEQWKQKGRSQMTPASANLIYFAFYFAIPFTILGVALTGPCMVLLPFRSIPSSCTDRSLSLLRLGS